MAADTLTPHLLSVRDSYRPANVVEPRFTVYRVTSVSNFSYGHRLCNYVGKCARLHGHNARVEVTLASASLDASGFVVDFDHLAQVARQWLDTTLDHRLLLRHDDPLCATLREAGEDFVALENNPTAEFLARMIFEHLAREGLPVERVRFWETDDSVAEWSDR